MRIERGACYREVGPDTHKGCHYILASQLKLVRAEERVRVRLLRKESGHVRGKGGMAEVAARALPLQWTGYRCARPWLLAWPSCNNRTRTPEERLV